MARAGRKRKDVLRRVGRVDWRAMAEDPSLLTRWNKARDDYLAMGVPYVWVLDPATRTAYSVTRKDGTTKVLSVLKTQNPSVEVLLSEIFA